MPFIYQLETSRLKMAAGSSIQIRPSGRTWLRWAESCRKTRFSYFLFLCHFSAECVCVCVVHRVGKKTAPNFHFLAEFVVADRTCRAVLVATWIGKWFKLCRRGGSHRQWPFSPFFFHFSRWTFTFHPMGIISATRGRDTKKSEALWAARKYYFSFSGKRRVHFPEEVTVMTRHCCCCCCMSVV